MTPEEKALVQSAIRWSRSVTSGVALKARVEALIFACPQCNHDTHKCPGCGTDVEHGDVACTNCLITRPMHPCVNCLVDSDEDPAPWCDCREDETCKGPCRKRAHSPERCPNRSVDYSEWMPALALHLLAGDKVRIGQDEADVVKARAELWHAHITSTKMMSGKWWDQVEPFDHIRVFATLIINDGGDPVDLEFPAETSMEIFMGAERRAAFTLQQAFPGTKEVGK